MIYDRVADGLIPKAIPCTGLLELERPDGIVQSTSRGFGRLTDGSASSPARTLPARKLSRSAILSPSRSSSAAAASGPSVRPMVVAANDAMAVHRASSVRHRSILASSFEDVRPASRTTVPPKRGNDAT